MSSNNALYLKPVLRKKCRDTNYDSEQINLTRDWRIINLARILVVIYLKFAMVIVQSQANRSQDLGRKLSSAVNSSQGPFSRLISKSEI